MCVFVCLYDSLLVWFSEGMCACVLVGVIVCLFVCVFVSVCVGLCGCVCACLRD